jgi:hypothetical protein
MFLCTTKLTIVVVAYHLKNTVEHPTLINTSFNLLSNIYMILYHELNIFNYFLLEKNKITIFLFEKLRFGMFLRTLNTSGMRTTSWEPLL